MSNNISTLVLEDHRKGRGHNITLQIYVEVEDGVQTDSLTRASVVYGSTHTPSCVRVTRSLETLVGVTGRPGDRRSDSTKTSLGLRTDEVKRIPENVSVSVWDCGQ